MVWTAHGIEDGSHILFETPAVIPLMISFSLSGLILIFVLIKSLLAGAMLALGLIILIVDIWYISRRR
jgi:hypothetical protein